LAIFKKFDTILKRFKRKKNEKTMSKLYGKSGSYLGALFLAFFLQTNLLLANILNISCPHKTISCKVELAQTPEEQEKGLMFRTHLESDEGMLFLSSYPLAMWMKNTYIPLDMIFADGKGAIIALHQNAVPHSLKTIGPFEGTTQVLEVKGGTIKSQGITKACTLSLNH
jgi:uncharacterized membrane protein (UPF0127 family)